jgi:signal transduction histidine kinase
MSAADEPQALRQTVARQALELEALAQELAETNNGVVALYAELDDRAEQLRQASDLKSRFLSYMSHEFRTPLGSITSLANILLSRMDGELSEEQARQVGFIRDSASELTEMVNDLLDLAKVEAGRIVISPDWFEMVDLFSTLRGMFRPIVDSKSIELVFEPPVGAPRLFTDHKKLSQVLRNLISNSLKFTQEGTVRVGASSDGDHVVFTVVDTGIGIAENHQQMLFQDFVQIDSPLQRRLRGTGLGLSLSRKLTELLGGQIGVRSQLGAGSTFWVRIPAHIPTPTPAEDGEAGA